MKTRKLVRRALFTAALSTASMMSSLTASTFGSDSGKPTSAIQLVQYQPGQQAQNAAQPATSVEAELRKMFEESGQPMPSMRSQDLPNANVIPPSQMKPAKGVAPAPNMAGQNRMTQNTKSPGPVTNNSQANGKPATSGQPKKNFLQKFMSKVSGKDQKAAEAAVVPPTPPGFQEPAPVPPAAAPSGVAKSPGGQQMRSNNGQAMNGNMSQVPPQPQHRNVGQTAVNNRPQNIAPPRSGQPVRAGQLANTPANNAPMKTVQNLPPVPNTKASPVSSPNQPVPQVPFRPQTRTASNNPSANSMASDAPKYVQPGNTPAFMSTSQMTPSAGQTNTGRPSQTASNQASPASTAAKPIVAQTPAAAPVMQLPPVDDAFEAPFTEIDDTNDVLDLDGLKTPAESQISAAADVVTSQQPLEVVPTVRVPEMREPAEPVGANEPVFVETKPTPEATGSPLEEEATEPVESQQNPFTEVRISEFDSGLNESITLPPIDDDGDDKVMLGEPAPPMEEFGNNLPAITLPPVDDEEAGVSAGSGDLKIPNVEIPGVSIPPAEQPTPVSSSTTTPDAAPAKIPSQGFDVTEPAPARSVDAERLQQTAEQERLLRQQRQIQSRAGQAGFKGFCPVTLRDKRELVDVNAEFTATFGLQTYTFASAEAKAAFEADPSRYAPAAGGSDIVLLVNSGEEQQGMLDYALWYRDRLYMFRSRETMAAFNQDPQRFANQY